MIENRETFMQRLSPFLPPSVMLDVELAYTLAKFAHRGQKRKELGPDGDPLRYFEHCRRVSLILIDEAQCPIRDLVCAALMHDGVEDTRDLTPAMIEHVFGTEVAGIVMTLSKVPKEGYLDRFWLCSDWRPYLIKACDRLDNLRSLKATAPEFQKRQLQETKEKYFPLFDRMIDLAPKEFKTRATNMRNLVEVTTKVGLLQLEE